MESKDYLTREQQSLDVQLTGRIQDISAEVTRLGAKDTLTDIEAQNFEELRSEFDELTHQQEKLHREAQTAFIARTAARGSVVRGDMDSDPLGEPDSIEGPKYRDPWNLDEMRAYPHDAEARRAEIRARALSAIEQLQGSTPARREVMTKMVEGTIETDSPTKNAELFLATTSPMYKRAFAKMMRGQQSTFTPEEQQAFSRAMSLTTTAGGFLIPQDLDPTVINTSDGSFNQIRQIARRVVATGNVWNGVSAGETSWSWDAEAAEVSDDASTFANPQITVHKGRGFVPISEEALADEANVTNEVARLMAAGKDTLESTGFITGTGSGQPFGVVTALNTIAGSIVTATTNNAFGFEDVYAMDNALPAKHRARGSWLANRAIYNLVRQFDTTGGAQLWERIGADVPALLLGRNAYEAEAMDGAIATADDYVLLYGDFQHYVIADRLGTTVQFIPHLFHTTTNRPSGQSGWYAYYRVGADVVHNGAFRLLHV